jgi:hypothetical protein
MRELRDERPEERESSLEGHEVPKSKSTNEADDHSAD